MLLAPTLISSFSETALTLPSDYVTALLSVYIRNRTAEQELSLAPLMLVMGKGISMNVVRKQELHHSNVESVVVV